MSWIYTILVSSLMFSSGSVGGSANYVLPNAQPIFVRTANPDETERIEKTFPLNANGRVAVSNVNGSIDIRGWDRNEVQVVAVKIAETEDGLADVDIRFESSPGNFSVETDCGDSRGHGSNSGWKNSRLNVSYTIMAPRGAVLDEIETVNGSVSVADFSNIIKVSAVNGTVIAKDLRGNASLETVNGEVNADFERLEQGGRIS